MALPEAEPGLVFRYDYVWTRETERNRAAGKDRPACIAIATDDDVDPQLAVILPITHSKPRGGAIGVEIPPRVRRNLGLDDEPCWVIVSEANIDDWPNAGISPLPGKPRVFAYVVLPGRLFETIKAEFLKHYDVKRAVRR